MKRKKNNFCLNKVSKLAQTLKKDTSTVSFTLYANAENDKNTKTVTENKIVTKLNNLYIDKSIRLGYFLKFKTSKTLKMVKMMENLTRFS